jgi:CheY-like chemotaxis protein
VVFEVLSAFMPAHTHRSWPSQQAATPEPTFRLLYVGNDLEFLAALRQLLTGPHYHIVACQDIRSAVLFLKGDPRYDLLLFELELEGGLARSMGQELTQLARSLPHRARLPVILVSPELAGKKIARAIGADECVSKAKVAAVTQTITRLLHSGIGELVGERANR